MKRQLVYRFPSTSGPAKQAVARLIQADVADTPPAGDFCPELCRAPSADHYCHDEAD
jgi:hypothetical protein